MEFMNLQFWLLIISIFSILFMMIYINKKGKKDQINKAFLFVLICIFIISFGVIAQTLGYYLLHMNPLYFEYFIYIGTCFLPVALFFTGLIFTNTKITFKKFYLLLFIVPTISLIVLWTNDLHGLFFAEYPYNLNLSEIKTGSYYGIFSIFNTILYAVALLRLVAYSIKNSGFFSKQAILFLCATIVPLVLNFLGSFKIIEMSAYVTPISFSIAIFLFALAIYKFQFLNISPIAMQRVVDRMSDSFLVISEDGIITDFNDTLLKTFDLKPENVRNVRFFKFVHSQGLEALNEDFINPILEKCKKTDTTFIVKREMESKNSYFNIEASGIFSKKAFLGTLILIKDVTQHVIDRNTIEDNQNILMERERLASLGQLIGGIAHNLKTPIMSIAGAAEGLTDLTNEYDASIGDPDVTNQDHHDIAKDMREWIEKIRSYTEYMSDVITAVKGQAVTMSDEQAVSFTLDELVKRVDILMKHELKNALVTLNVQMEADPNIVLKGNINSLVQVINNMISNAIQAYNGKSDQNIDFILSQEGNSIMLSVQDYAGGLPDEVQQKLFKEMITTKGKNGTGLGLFMSYSTIRAHFNGNISYETQKGNGTVFHIVLPRK